MIKKLKHFIYIGLLLLIYSNVSADNILQISSAQVQANQQVSIQVVINNTNPFVAFQVDVPIPSAFIYVANSAALSPGRSNGHLINATLLNGNILRILGFSFSNTPFLGNSGTVASFTLTANSVPGDYILTPNNAIIGNAASANILSSVVNGNISILSPNINIGTPTIDFGQIPLGSSSDQYINISNTGNQDLQISSITFNSTYFAVIGNTSFTIPANGSSTVLVRFTSTVKGNYLKTMTIASNDPDQPSSTVSLQSVAFAVNEIHCRSMFAYSGTQANLSLSINNMEAFTGFQFDLQLPSALTYQQGSVQLTNRKANHVVSANILSGNILRILAYSANNQSFSGNDGNVITMSFLVNGNGGWYSLNLSNVIIGNSSGENIISAYYNNYLEIAAANIASNSDLFYGDVSILDTAIQYLRIYNYGNDTLKVNQLQFTNLNFFSTKTLPFTVNSWEYVDIPVKFHTTNEGQAIGMMKIFSNDPDENPKNINLTGNVFIPNSFSVIDTSCFQTDTVTIELSAENYEAFVGFQFDIDFPASMTYIPNSATLTNRSQGHNVQSTLINSTTVRVIAFSFQQQPFQGNSGALVKMQFIVNAASSVNTLPLTISNVIMGNNLSENILYTTNNGEIQIIEKKNLKLTVLLEGLYLNANLMNNSLNDAGLPQWHDNTIADIINIDIREASMPFNIIESISTNLLINGIINTSINCKKNSSFYIVIRNRNHIETWSANPVSFADDTVYYDFSTSANKAFGNNLKELAPGVYGIYGGDVNQDGIVDTQDMISVDNLTYLITFGYYPEDVNGDGIVDTQDMLIIDNNSYNIIMSQYPVAP